MGKAVKILVFLVVFLSGTEALHAQYKLKITEIQIRTQEGGKFEKYSDKEANMTSDLPVTVMLYKDKSVSYYSCFHLVERGKRFRLVNHDYVQYNDHRHKGDRQVLRYKKNDDFKGRINGVSEQNIQYNENLGFGIQVIYRFELLLD